MARLEELEKKKLPESVLNNLPCTEEASEEITTDADSVKEEEKSVPQNSIRTFSEDEGSEDLDDSQNFLSLNTEGTEFSVKSQKDLRSKQTFSKNAQDFRQNMLDGSRINREPVQVRRNRQQKALLSGKNKLIKT
jgi:hypothetical protein